ncbi:hypothetical protein ABIB40_002321 [Pedobacter sp. UYP30]|uniref:thiamine pyrophosphokinase n=1 Tax=Pedobacter sp. UYP30 TaxID=1756400 RepID=UPI003391BA30
MSSHHIVREKQEPALYIDEIGEFEEELLGQLLEWSPTLLVNAKSYDKISSWNIKVDVLVNGKVEDVQEYTKLINSSTDSLATALSYLQREQFPAVNIITETFDAGRFYGWCDKINVVVFTSTHKYYVISPSFSVWKPAGIIFKVFGNDQLTPTNLKSLENNEYEVISDGFVKFGFTGSTIFIGEAL